MSPLPKSVSIQYRDTVYQVQSRGGGYHLRGAQQITVCEHLDAIITLLHQGKAPAIRCLTSKSISISIDRSSVSGSCAALLRSGLESLEPTDIRNFTVYPL